MHIPRNEAMGIAMSEPLTMNDHEFTVRVEWDAPAGVWYVAESDVPGLVAEADTLEEFTRNVVLLVPEMLELNAHLLGEPVQGAIPLNIVATKHLELWV